VENVVEIFDMQGQVRNLSIPGFIYFPKRNLGSKGITKGRAHCNVSLHAGGRLKDFFRTVLILIGQLWIMKFGEYRAGLKPAPTGFEADRRHFFVFKKRNAVPNGNNAETILKIVISLPRLFV